MSTAGEIAIGLVMFVGLVGVVVPVLPGLLLIWGAGLAWTILDGGGLVRWGVFVLLSVLLIVGTVAKYVLPARSATTAGAPRLTLVIGAVGALAGFFLIPVVGLLVGGIAGVLLAEWRRLGEVGAAWRSTRAVLLAFGLGVLAEAVAGVLMVLVWLGAALTT